MSDLTNVQLVDDEDFENVYISQNNNSVRLLKSSSKILKRKCHKVLKKKLKKYKIRRNGEEDPDVLDVSKTFHSSLIIKSPSSQTSPDNKLYISDYIQPNYLFKNMGKRKKCNILTESNREIGEDQKKPEILLPLITSESQDKTHTNAFKLLMDSRHKSIGSNSPGKDKPLNEVESQEVTEKREMKAKRILSLQKMAEAKGSIKKQEIEEQREGYIKKQMLKRAERFKAMITQDTAEHKSNSKVKEPASPKHTSEVKDNRIDIKKTLQLCDMFEPIHRETINEKEKIKKMSHEDEEFLNKLSPSIRKKENMMSYFKKLPKSPEEDDIVHSDDSSHNIIKVKFTPKRKKKSVKKKNALQSLVTNSSEHHSSDKDICEQDAAQTTVDCKNDIITKESNCTVDQSGLTNDESRPRRISKRPAKYIEDVEILSSDEDLHIFTPKKKKNLEKNKIVKNDTEVEKSLSNGKDTYTGTIKKNTSDMTKNKNRSNKTVSLNPVVSSKKTMKSSNDTKSNPVKLAPIFMSKQTSNSISSAEKVAKQKFLQSGIPEKLKKSIPPQQSISALDLFYPVVHVQQTDTKLPGCITINFDHIVDDFITDDSPNTANEDVYKNLLNLSKRETKAISLTNKNKDDLLQYIKSSYKKFPVYRTYHLLKGKCRGEFRDFNYPDLDNSIEIVNGCLSKDSDIVEKLCWVDKYKPNSSKQIIGNFLAIEELKKWLQTWTENLVKTRKNIESDGSDFSDFVDSDVDSRESFRNSNSVLIISGDVGSGKTSSVYAVAAELAIKVIEVNASSKRTGKIMLQDLQEATKSHKVDRGKSGTECSQNIQEILKTKGTHKKRGRPKKIKEVVTKSNSSDSQKSELSETQSQDSVRTDMSLILIDDADIVFDQDDGFCSAISQLIQSSKRPVILVTSSLSCPHLQKFIQYGKIICMQRFLPRMLGVWLDIMCLADISTCCLGLGNHLLDFCKGDIRKTINWLQFYMTSYKYIKAGSPLSEDTLSQELDKHKFNIDDECSSMSWSDRESILDCNEASNVSSNFIQAHINMILSNLPPNLLNLWWSIPKILDYDNLMKKDNQNVKKPGSKQLLTISKMLDIVSETDYLTGNISDCRNDITGTLWGSKETASVDESDNLDYYDWSEGVRNDIASELAMSGLRHSHKELECETSLDMSIPGYTVERERDKIILRHHTLTSYLSPGAVLDRKALALDYWSSCRTICRLENNKTDANVKRNNRFCHYLKSLNILCKNDYFDALSKSLSGNDTGKL
ncbi:ATPase family AAA domain-containing protein 5 isoform X1 [Colias croceus]|uniref:ATPase family AAA domain-containing protein 5 isoform X1 n=2 Tax=Colias crocea TaxID=72248 RepID=UPI001E27C146|nr:ATPase family AAA domain-containing protein 5 isoform X1 [Colias croceus]